MDGIGWKRLEMGENDKHFWKWLEIAETDGTGWTWLEMAGNCLKRGGLITA